MKLIIDTDMGIDDAIALLMVLAQPEAELKAITTVLGNVSLAQATLNAGVILEIANAPLIPIYRGCANPLLQYDPVDAREFHGPDGLGGVGKSETSRPVESEHASLALIGLARERPGELTLLTLGPLTNVALAIRLDPNFLKNLNRLILMAGAVDGRGNETSCSEFNIFVDPEAAKIVFDALNEVDLGIWLVSWEATLDHGIPFPTWQKIITSSNSPTAQFVQKMNVYAQQHLEAANYPGMLWPDPLAAAVALAPDIVVSQEYRFVEVVAGQGPARGQTLVDYRPNRQYSPNVHIVRQVNMQKFQDLLQMAVR